ncbi:MAG: phospho-N-acetylmuramoyl-pentapeptide-transferase [Nocardioides sp.]|uniref:phospho-N-acetylmuramoyl-pentapeptide- transferase n=1 Tax=Nocardioides sp. TaxID=35761 RepID=UPI003D6B39AF
MRAILLSGGIALLLSLIGTRFAIVQFTRLGYGQPIREDGPTTHLVKRGTPTMGGVAIVLSTVVGYFAAMLLTGGTPSATAYLLLFLLVGMAVVGFLDDFIKVVMQRNLGLRGRAKIVGQTIVAVVFGVLALHSSMADADGVTPASDRLSFIRDFGPHLLGGSGPLYWAGGAVLLTVIWVMVTGTSNATNLTDGLDGLVAGSAALVFATYTIISIWQSNQRCGRTGLEGGTCYEVRDPLDMAILAAAIAGACFGFLWWNASPAKIIMGDTGSLALGSVLAGFAITSRTELLLIIIGGLYVMETVAVMMQVSWFKLTRKLTGTPKRIFRMTPIHHHFEMLGWEQVTVTIRFWIITGLCVAAGLGIFYAEWVAGI